MPNYEQPPLDPEIFSVEETQEPSTKVPATPLSDQYRSIQAVEEWIGNKKTEVDTDREELEDNPPSPLIDEQEAIARAYSLGVISGKQALLRDAVETISVTIDLREKK